MKLVHPSFLLALCLLSPLPCLAQDILATADSILTEEDKDVLLKAQEEETRCLQLIVLRLLWKEDAPADIEALTATVKDWQTAQAATKQLEAASKPNAVSPLQDRFEPKKMGFYWQIKNWCAKNTQMSQQVQLLQAVLPAGMPDQEEHLRMHAELTDLLMAQTEAFCKACDLLKLVTDKASADAQAEPFVALIKQSVDLDMKIGAFDARWLSEADRDYIIKKVAPIRADANLFRELSRVTEADCFGSSILEAQLQSLGLPSKK